jgi:hypothetical protein
MIRFSKNAKKIRERSTLNDEKDLNSFSMLLIKIVGFFGIILGMIILIAFWYWIIKLLYKIK